MENTVLVIAIKRHLGNPMTRKTYRSFESTAEAFEYVKGLDKNLYSRVTIYEEKEVIDF